MQLYQFNEYFLFFAQQPRKTVLSCTNRARKSAAFIQSILMAQVPSMCFVTKKQPVGGGQCSKRDWTARLISIAVGLTTNEVLVT